MYWFIFHIMHIFTFLSSSQSVRHDIHSLHLIRYHLGPSWSYGSLLYNYPSQLNLWFLIPLMVKSTRYNMWKKLSESCDRSVVFCRYTGSTTNKTDHHDITDILLKLALNTTNQTKNKIWCIKIKIRTWAVIFTLTLLTQLYVSWKAMYSHI
jgi:hypothetical protein